MDVRPYRPSDRDGVVGLWLRCGLVVAHNNPDRDIERKLAQSPEWFLVGDDGGTVVATCMVGYDGHRGWINYLAVDPDVRGRGLGRRIVERAEAILIAAGCPKINLQVRSTNDAVIRFYEAIGFTVDPVTSLGKRLEPDEPHESFRRDD